MSDKPAETERPADEPEPAPENKPATPTASPGTVPALRTPEYEDPDATKPAAG